MVLSDSPKPNLFQKKRLSLITTATGMPGLPDGHEGHSNDGPLSGSLHQSQRYSPSQLGNFGEPSNEARASPPSSNSATLIRQSSTSVESKPKEPTKTLSLDRTNDAVYAATTNVVKAIMTLSQGVEKAIAGDYLDLVRNVGIELRTLLGSVDALSSIFPPQAHKEVEMAHKVLAKDYAELVSAMRLAQQYSETTLDAEYRK